jgi:hypothetical protein
MITPNPNYPYRIEAITKTGEPIDVRIQKPLNFREPLLTFKCKKCWQYIMYGRTMGNRSIAISFQRDDNGWFAVPHNDVCKYYKNRF